MTQEQQDAINEMKRILDQSNARRAIKPDSPNTPREQGKSEGVVPKPGESR